MSFGRSTTIETYSAASRNRVANIGTSSRPAWIHPLRGTSTTGASDPAPAKNRVGSGGRMMCMWALYYSDQPPYIEFLNVIGIFDLESSPQLFPYSLIPFFPGGCKTLSPQPRHALQNADAARSAAPGFTARSRIITKRDPYGIVVDLKTCWRHKFLIETQKRHLKMSPNEERERSLQAGLAFGASSSISAVWMPPKCLCHAVQVDVEDALKLQRCQSLGSRSESMESCKKHRNHNIFHGFFFDAPPSQLQTASRPKRCVDPTSQLNMELLSEDCQYHYHYKSPLKNIEEL